MGHLPRPKNDDLKVGTGRSQENGGGTLCIGVNFAGTKFARTWVNGKEATGNAGREEGGDPPPTQIITQNLCTKSAGGK